MFMSTGNETTEEAAMRLFPNLGRSSRPDTVDLSDYTVTAQDFCQLVDIPFDVLVRVRPDTECSCTLFYLYRVIRRVRPDWLKTRLPACYADKWTAKELDAAERQCVFGDKVRQCAEKRETGYIEQSSQCRPSSFEYYSEHTLVGNSSPPSPIFEAANSDDSDDWNDEDDLNKSSVEYEDSDIVTDVIDESSRKDEQSQGYIHLFKQRTIYFSILTCHSPSNFSIFSKIVSFWET